MVVFVRNIPIDTEPKDLRNFFRPALENGFLRSASEGVIDVNKLILHDPNTNHIEHHGLVTIEPDSLALKAIEKLDGSLLKGQKVSVRQYHMRNRTRFIYCERRRPLEASLEY